MQIRSYQGFTPQIGENCFIDPSSVIIGRVSIGCNSSIWCNSVIRGDVSSISIGENSNIQDLTMLHVTHYNPSISAEAPLLIGNNVTIGHNCCLHACTIGDNVLVGMGSTLLDNCVIETQVFIGAGSVVPPNKRLESGYLYFGNPVKRIRPLSEQEVQFIQYSAEHYVRVKNAHLESV